MPIHPRNNASVIGASPSTDAPAGFEPASPATRKTVTEHALWVNVGAGQERPEWVYIIVQFVDGKPNFDVEPRWAREDDLPKRVRHLSNSAEICTGGAALSR